MSDAEALKITPALEVSTKLWLSAKAPCTPGRPPEMIECHFYGTIRDFFSKFYVQVVNETLF